MSSKVLILKKKDFTRVDNRDLRLLFVVVVVVLFKSVRVYSFYISGKLGSIL